MSAKAKPLRPLGGNAAAAANTAGGSDCLRRVLAQEAQGIAMLSEGIDAVLPALDTLAAVKGRVIVTGMGKSGHVARKIAATLASTGTPALFVHPAEASHGDLGMIAPGDGVIALSYSGNTAELADIVTYSRRFGIPLVAITASGESALARAADHAILLPPAPEACPMGLAPTTSTAMMLALGDAMAIALLERRGFTTSDFRQLHPGGNLGRRLLKVADVMHRDDAVPLAPLGTRMSEAIVIMSAKSFGCVGITDGRGQLIGIVTDGDLRRHMVPDLPTLLVDAVMSALPRTIGADALAAEALAEMNGRDGRRPITSLFVAEGGRPIGILHVHDCLRAGVV
jgi:arabinose-5-phosphate isomerase